jgi:hypothetical protein
MPVYVFQLHILPEVVRNLAYGKTTWSSVESEFPKFEQQESVTKPA